MNQLVSLLNSQKEAFLSILIERMNSASKHNWREKVFENTLKIFLKKNGFNIDVPKSYPNKIGLECDIAAEKGATLMIEIKRFRSAEACVSVAGGTLDQWVGELKGFPRDYLIDIAKAVLAAQHSENTQGIAIAFIAVDSDDKHSHQTKLNAICSTLASTFNLESDIIDFEIFMDNNQRPVRLLAPCLSSKLI